MKKFIIAFIAVLYSFLGNSMLFAAADTWTRKADFGGPARKNAVGFSIGGMGCIGTGNNGLFAKDLWKYDPATDTWKQKEDFAGTARDGAVGFSIGSKVYIGTGNDGSRKGDFWEYDLAASTWTQRPAFGGTTRKYAVGFSIGSKGYIGTGNDGSKIKDFWEYDPAANTWTRKVDFGGTGRVGAVGFSIGGKGYIGTGDDGSSGTKDFWEYDPVANTWTRKADFGGTARLFAVGFSIGSKGYIGTGTDGVSTAYNDFWEYDPVANTWTRKADFMGTARQFAVGFTIGSKGYIGTGNDSSLLKDFWEYDPGTLSNLVISNAGPGLGTVTSNPSGINCGSDCSENYSSGTSVTLTSQPSAGFAFTGWSGDCSGNATTCTLTMDASKNVTATFAPRFVVGQGTDADCVLDTQTNLVWAKNANLSNTTWQGALDWASSLNLCGYTDWRVPEIAELQGLINGREGAPGTWLNSQGFTYVQKDNYYWSFTTLAGDNRYAYIVDMWYVGALDNNLKTINRFVWPVHTGQPGSFYNLVISNAGTGTGTVSSTPTGINCRIDCSENFAYWTSVTLTAQPSAGSSFTGW